MQTQQRRVLLLLSAILVVTDDFVCMGQLVVGQEDVPGVCDGEEVFSPTQKCALVPPRLLDVYGGGQFCCHCYLGKQIIPNIIPIIPQEKEVDRGWFKATSDCCCLGAISSLLGWIDTGVILRTLIQRRKKKKTAPQLSPFCADRSQRWGTHENKSPFLSCPPAYSALCCYGNDRPDWRLVKR